MMFVLIRKGLGIHTLCTPLLTTPNGQKSGSPKTLCGGKVEGKKISNISTVYFNTVFGIYKRVSVVQDETAGLYTSYALTYTC